MQPENSQQVPNGFEQAPVGPVGPENMAHLPPLEVAPIGGLERFEQAAEASARVSDATSTAQQTAAPVAPVAPVQLQPQQQAATAAPLTAADEDLIEKEWVDKAKEIITETKDDPYTRTARVNELQRNYLQKRYGKVVGASE